MISISMQLFLDFFTLPMNALQSFEISADLTSSHGAAKQKT